MPHNFIISQRKSEAVASFFQHQSDVDEDLHWSVGSLVCLLTGFGILAGDFLAEE